MKFMQYNQNQTLLLPPSLVECLPEDHLCFVIDDVVNSFNLSMIERGYVEEGHPAYHPKMMIKILFYGYTQDVRSSRKLENKTVEDIAFRYLSANAHLDHGTINLFRKTHLSELPFIFAQIIAAIKGLGLADFSDLSLDGTKIKAQASTDNLFTKKEITRLKSRIETFLAESDEVDLKEDKQFGKKRGYNQMPEHLADPKVRREKIRKIQKKLADLNNAGREIDRKQKEAKKDDKENKTQKGRRKQEKIRNLSSNTTDPEASLMKMKDGLSRMAYNVGLTTAKQFIAAYDVSDNPSDTRSLPEMVKKTEENTGQKVKKIKADAAYFTKNNINFLTDNQTEAFIPDTYMRADQRKEDKAKKENKPEKYDRKNFVYDKENDQFICPEGKPLKRAKYDHNKGKDVRTYRGAQCQDCSCRSLCTKGKIRSFTFDFELEAMRQIMRTRLNTTEGRRKYGERLYEIEPVMADLKRNQGLIEFLCRGKEMALVETGLASSAHNLKKLFFGLKRIGMKRKEVDWSSLMKTQTA